MNRADRRMRLQPRRDQPGVALLALHPREQRAQPAQRQPGIERRSRDADDIGPAAQPLDLAPVGGDHRAADHVRMAVEELGGRMDDIIRSEEHTSELQSLMRSSYAVFCLKKTNRQYYTYKKQR